MANGENLAAHGVAVQSSQAGAASAHLALTSGHTTANQLSMMGSAATSTTMSGVRLNGPSGLHSRTLAEREPWWEVDLRHVADVSVIEFSFGPVHPRTPLWVMASERQIGRRGNRLRDAKAQSRVAIKVPVAQLQAQPVVVAVRGRTAARRASGPR